MIKLPSIASESAYELDPLWPRSEWNPSGGWGVPPLPRPRSFARPAPLPTSDSLG